MPLEHIETYKGWAAKRPDGGGDTPYMVYLLSRNWGTVNVTIEGTAALSEAIDMRFFSGGLVVIPSTWTDAELGFKASDSEDGTFYPVYDENGVQLTIDNIATATARAYTLPAELYGANYIKLWSTDGSGGDTNQDDARSIIVIFKG